jgi:hypothetical protein
MTDRELMQQALENICGAKLCEINSMSSRTEMIRLLDEAITALRNRLAQPEQEPVAWYDKHGMVTHDPFEGIRPLYTNPRRQWVGLTEEELVKIWTGTPAESEYWFEFAKAIEAKLKEKNT